MAQAVVYCRVSTKEQTLNLSLATQEKACRDYCLRNGYDVAEVFVDKGESAKTIDRPEFQKMLGYCRLNRGRVAAVVVYSVNRFARNTHDHVTVRALLALHGVTVRSTTEGIDDSPQGKLVEGITSVIAEYENNVKAERTKVGMAEAMKNGRWPFLPPLGYVREGSRNLSTLRPDPLRAPLIAQAFSLFATGAHTKKRVLEKMTALGLRTVAGKELASQTFDRMLRNPIYAGRLTVSRWSLNEVAGFPSLVTLAEFERVQALLDGRRVTSKAHLRSHPDFPLRHFARCDHCGRPLTASWSRGRLGERYGYYRCPNSACKGVNARREELHAGFGRFLERFQPRPEYARLFRAVVEDEWSGRQREVVAYCRGLERRLDDLRTQRAQYVDAITFGSITKEEGRERLDAVNEEMARLRLELNEAHLEELDVEAVLNFAEHLVTNAARLWAEAKPEERERLQRALFPEGVTFGASGFGTRATCMMFSELQPSQVGKLQVASPTGFEPVSPP